MNYEQKDFASEISRDVFTTLEGAKDEINESIRYAIKASKATNDKLTVNCTFTVKWNLENETLTVLGKIDFEEAQ